MNTLNTLIEDLKNLETENEKLGKSIEEKRALILDVLNKENLKQYKNDLATVSFVERKTIKFISKKEDVLKSLEDKSLVKYFDVIPKQIIPETKQINKKFEDDLKNGDFSLEGVEVETKESPMIRFNK